VAAYIGSFVFVLIFWGLKAPTGPGPLHSRGS